MKAKNSMFLIIFIVLGIGILLNSLSIQNISVKEDLLRNGVAGTGSMEPLISKDLYQEVSVVNRELTDNETLVEGKIYIYTREDGNETVYVVHRLLGKYDIDDRTVYVFKGDNNLYVDDVVYRSQIIREVVRVDFYET